MIGFRSKSPEMGVQIPRSFHSEVSAQGPVRRVGQTLGGGVPQACGTPREPCRRGAFAAPPRSDDAVDSAQVRGQSGRGVHQEQECDQFGSSLWRGPPRFIGQHFWARGYFVSTVGRDETVIRDYIKNREKEDQRLDQLNLWRSLATLRWPISRGRVSVPIRRFERLTTRMPSALPGDVTNSGEIK